MCGRSDTLKAAGQSIIGGEGAASSPRSEKRDGLQLHETRIIALNSVPVVVLKMKQYTNLGRTKKMSLGQLKKSDAKNATDGIMDSLFDHDKPRFAKIDKISHHAKYVCVCE